MWAALQCLKKLLAMANEYMETVKQFKEQAASSMLGKGESLQFPASNSRKRSLNLTPPRKAREEVQATQDEDI